MTRFDPGQALVAERLRRQARRSAAGAVERGDRAGLGRVEEGEAVAPDAGVARLGDVQRRGRGHCRIGRVASGPEHREPRRRRQRLAGGDHSVARENRRAMGFGYRA